MLLVESNLLCFVFTTIRNVSVVCISKRWQLNVVFNTLLRIIIKKTFKPHIMFLRESVLTKDQWCFYRFSWPYVITGSGDNLAAIIQQAIIDYDLTKWEIFPHYWPFIRVIHQLPHKGQWRWALRLSVICAQENRLNEQLWRRWFETPSHSIRSHSNAKPIMPSPPTQKHVSRPHD